MTRGRPTAASMTVFLSVAQTASGVGENPAAGHGLPKRGEGGRRGARVGASGVVARHAGWPHAAHSSALSGGGGHAAAHAGAAAVQTAAAIGPDAGSAAEARACARWDAAMSPARRTRGAVPTEAGSFETIVVGCGVGSAGQ
jgi:hypothetical protein